MLSLLLLFSVTTFSSISSSIFIELSSLLSFKSFKLLSKFISLFIIFIFLSFSSLILISLLFLFLFKKILFPLLLLLSLFIFSSSANFGSIKVFSLLWPDNISIKLWLSSAKVPSFLGTLFLKYNWHNCLEFIIFLAVSVHFIPKSYKHLIYVCSGQSINLWLLKVLYNLIIVLKSFFSFFICLISLIFSSIIFLKFINSSIVPDNKGNPFISFILLFNSAIVFSFFIKKFFVLLIHSFIILILFLKIIISFSSIFSSMISLIVKFFNISLSFKSDSAWVKSNFNLITWFHVLIRYELK